MCRQTEVATLNAQRATLNVQLDMIADGVAIVLNNDKIQTYLRNALAKSAVSPPGLNSNRKLLAHFQRHAHRPAGLRIDRTPERPRR